MTESDKAAPRDFGPVWLEHSKSARVAQVDYGRWIINTLWLMHSGAIAGLMSKWTSGAIPKPWSIAVFATGILFAFLAAACAWFNFTVAADFYNRYLYGGDRWYDFDSRKHGGWMKLTAILAMVAIAISISCLVAGVIVTLFSA